MLFGERKHSLILAAKELSSDKSVMVANGGNTRLKNWKLTYLKPSPRGHRVSWNFSSLNHLSTPLAMRNVDADVAEVAAVEQG